MLLKMSHLAEMLVGGCPGPDTRDVECGEAQRGQHLFGEPGLWEKARTVAADAVTELLQEGHSGGKRGIDHLPRRSAYQIGNETTRCSPGGRQLGLPSDRLGTRTQ